MSTNTSSAKGLPRSTYVAGRTPSKAGVKPPSASVAGPHSSARTLTPAVTLKGPPAERKSVGPVKPSSSATKAGVTPTTKTPKIASTMAASHARRALPISKTMKPKLATTKLSLPLQKVPLKTSPKKPKTQSLTKQPGEQTANNVSSQELGIQTDEGEILNHGSVMESTTFLSPSPFVVAEIERMRQANTQLQLVALQRPTNLPEQDYAKTKGRTTISFHEHVREVHRSLVCVVDHTDSNQKMPNNFSEPKMDEGTLALQGHFRRI